MFKLTSHGRATLVAPRCATVLVGANGSGKTCLLRAIRHTRQQFGHAVSDIVDGARIDLQTVEAVLRSVEASRSPTVLLDDLGDSLDFETMHAVMKRLTSARTARIYDIYIATHSPYVVDYFHVNAVFVVRRVDDAIGGAPLDRAADRMFTRHRAGYQTGELWAMVGNQLQRTSSTCWAEPVP